MIGRFRYIFTKIEKGKLSPGVVIRVPFGSISQKWTVSSNDDNVRNHLAKHYVTIKIQDLTIMG